MMNIDTHLDDTHNGDTPTSTGLLSNSLTSRLTSTTSLPAQNSAAKLQNTSQQIRHHALPYSRVGEVVAKIESIIEGITVSITEDKVMTIPLKNRRAVRNEEEQLIKFPSQDPHEAWKFIALMRILELSHEALVTGVVTTKRDIYYKDPELFQRQTVVDRFVDDIAYTLGVNRDALNVVATAKGLMIGNLTIKRKDGSSTEYWSESEGTLIPKTDEIEHVNIGQSTSILVIEKEATFRTLAAGAFWKNCQAGHVILVTAKGYPDIQTRQFLHALITTHPHLSIYALVDYDPYGIGIMATYKHSSQALAHETNLTIPSMQWLGVRSSDFLHEETYQEQLLPLTKKDRNIAAKMLAKYGSEILEPEWRGELQLMLMLNKKAEIQILGDEHRLGQWLDGKLTAMGIEETSAMSF